MSYRDEWGRFVLFVSLRFSAYFREKIAPKAWFGPRERDPITLHFARELPERFLIFRRKFHEFEARKNIRFLGSKVRAPHAKRESVAFLVFKADDRFGGIVVRKVHPVIECDEKSTFGSV